LVVRKKLEDEEKVDLMHGKPICADKPIQLIGVHNYHLHKASNLISNRYYV
jgi:hypothetical protein